MLGAAGGGGSGAWPLDPWSAWLGMFYGMLLLLVAFNLLMFAALRDRLYLWYVSFLLISGVYFLGFEGVLPSMVERLGGPMGFHLLMICVISCLASVFGRFFLKTAQYLPRFDKLVLGNIALCLLGVGASPLLGFQGRSAYSQLLGVLSPFLVFIPGILRWRQGYRPARFYVLSWGVLSLASCAFVGLGADFDLGLRVFQIGFLLMLILLTLALVERVRKEREEQELCLQAMARTERMTSLGHIVAGMAHEINNPNNFIHFNLPVLRKYLEAIHPFLARRHEAEPDLRILHLPYRAFWDDLHKLIDNMEHGSRRIAEIVAELKRYTASGAQEGKSPLPLPVVIDRAMRLTGKQLGKMVKRFEVSEQPDLPAVQMSGNKIEQVIVNLLLNAGQAADKEDSWVRLSSRRAVDDPRWVELRVEDNGVGIPARQLDLIFKPFFTSKSRAEGTGLGLSISRKIIEEHGGSISVESTEGCGASFVVRLPACPGGHEL